MKRRWRRRLMRDTWLERRSTTYRSVIATGFERAGLPTIARRPKTTSMPEPVAFPDPIRPDPIRNDQPRAEPPRLEMVEAPAPEPVHVEPVPMQIEAEPQHPHYDEVPMAAAAHANGPTEPLFDDLDVPAILKRDRRFVQ